MRKNASKPSVGFRQIFEALLPVRRIRHWFKVLGPALRRPPLITAQELIMGLVFHVMAGVALWPNL